MNMNGSEIYNKYKDVHIGALINSESNLSILNNWLHENLFFRENMKDKRSKLLPVSNDFQSTQYNSASSTEICKNFEVNHKKTYTFIEGSKRKEMYIQNSFTLEPVFQTNDAEKKDNQDYCPTRLSIVEHDIVNHPKYEVIAGIIDEIRRQVCAHAMRIRNNGKIMKGKMTVLYSRPGDQHQVLHKDDNENDDGSRAFVMSCIVALQNNTTLDLATKLHSLKRDTCAISKGSFVNFCGSQIHAGSSYSYPNLRLHFYLHEDLRVLNKVFDGSIKLQEYCKYPGCDFCTRSLRYLNEHHYPLVHKDWWQKQKDSKSVVKPDKDGTYHCLANRPCDGIRCKTPRGIRTHYATKHKAWWRSKRYKNRTGK